MFGFISVAVLCVCLAYAVYVALDIPADTSLEPKVSQEERNRKEIDSLIEDFFRTKFKTDVVFKKSKKSIRECCRNLPFLKYASTEEFMIVDNAPEYSGTCEVFDIAPAIKRLTH